MNTIVVYSSVSGNRLKYALDWLLRERLQLDYRITADETETTGHPCFIAYGKPLNHAISIAACGLLSQTGIQKCEVTTAEWNDIPTLFAVNESGCTVPFDLLSAIFFLLSRYEEYYPYKPDKHGRYPAPESILYKNGWLQRPIVDEWVHVFGKLLQATGLNPDTARFQFCPTYDIDMAYSHLHKGFARLAGAYMRALLKGDLEQIGERMKVLKRRRKDPYDSFRWLRLLHREYGIKPNYFVLCALKATAFDKNIHPQRPAMMRVIKNLARDGVIGLHPSYYAMQDDKLSREKKMLIQVSGHDVVISRQHYIRLTVPGTFRLLMQNRITDDYSMGYGAHLGFRAGTGSSFFWFDPERDTTTPLRIHPFCFMDTTAHYEAGLSPTAAFEKLEAMSGILEKTGSTLTTVFHNFSLGSDAEWKGWREAYERFIKKKSHAGTHGLTPGI